MPDSETAVMEPPVNWRQQAKQLGISLYHRKKEEVLKEIKSVRNNLLMENTEPNATLEITEVPPTVIEPIDEAPKTEAEVKTKESIEPIIEHEKYEVGNLTPVEDLMRRIETLENRVNLIILRIDRFVDVDAVSKSKRTKGL